MISDIEHLFTCLLANCISFLEKMSIQILCSLKVELFYLFVFVTEFYEFFLYFYINLLLDIQFAYVFFHLVGYLFILLMVSFAIQKLFSLV